MRQLCGFGGFVTYNFPGEQTRGGQSMRGAACLLDWTANKSHPRVAVSIGWSVAFPGELSMSIGFLTVYLTSRYISFVCLSTLSRYDFGGGRNCRFRWG